ncbi:DMT family transporter [Candidatus Bipolaricaulota bacterium]
MDWRSSIRVYGALFSAMLVWGISFLAVKDAVGTIPVLSLNFVRFAIAAVLLGLFGLRRRRLAISKRDLWTLAGLTVLSPVGYFLFETHGISMTQASHASILIAAIPIAVYLIAFARRQEPATWRKTVGIALAFSGILTIVLTAPGEEGASLIGDLLILGAVLCAAARTTLIKDVLRRVTPLQLTFYQFAFSLLVFGPLASTSGFAWIGEMTPFLWAEVLFLGVFCSAGAFLAMHYALSHISATRVAVSANAVPIVTLLAEAALFGVLLTPLKLLGALLTITGVLLAQLRSSTLRTSRPAERSG